MLRSSARGIQDAHESPEPWKQMIKGEELAGSPMSVAGYLVTMVDSAGMMEIFLVIIDV